MTHKDNCFPNPSHYGVTITGEHRKETNPNSFKEWNREGISPQRLSHTINACYREGKYKECGQLITVAKKWLYDGSQASEFFERFTYLNDEEIYQCIRAYKTAREGGEGVTPKEQWAGMIATFIEGKQIKRGFIAKVYEARWKEKLPRDAHLTPIPIASDVQRYIELYLLRYRLTHKRVIKVNQFTEISEKAKAKKERKQNRREFKSQSFGPASKTKSISAH